jgi:hypothetical protein
VFELQAILATDDEVIAMLAEKFFLTLETLRSRISDDRPPIVISTAPHIPIKQSASPSAPCTASLLLSKQTTLGTLGPDRLAGGRRT